MRVAVLARAEVAKNTGRFSVVSKKKRNRFHAEKKLIYIIDRGPRGGEHGISNTLIGESRRSENLTSEQMQVDEEENWKWTKNTRATNLANPTNATQIFGSLKSPRA